MYTYFDAHCDTMLKMYKDKVGIDDCRLMVNTRNSVGYKSVIQVFALFNSGTMHEEEMMSCLDYFKDECKKQSDVISLCLSSSEIETNEKTMSAILAIEALGNQPDYTVESVKHFYDAGVRFMSLVWNGDNVLCGGCEGSGTGITESGKKTLVEMEKYKIILDVSHMSDKSFWESLENYTLPVCATHSNSRAVCNHKRNLTDEQFKALAERGGVCGINFYPPFLSGEKAEIGDIIKHIEHFLSLGGEDNIGIGSDFDGIDFAPKDMENSAQIYKLFDAMLSLNYSEELVEKIAYRNFMSFFDKFTD